MGFEGLRKMKKHFFDDCLGYFMYDKKMEVNMKKITLSVLFFYILILNIPGEDCPQKNVIFKLSSDMESLKKVPALDYSNIVSAGALMKKDGTDLTVCFSNGDFTIKQLANDFVLPIKKENEFIVDIEFRNGKDKVIPGIYNGSSTFGKPFWVYAEVKVPVGEAGTMVSLGIREGTATIINLTKDSVCGTFDLRTKADSQMQSHLSGEFNVKLEHSRW
jgi:hypothetical protein